jgi:hypothetical protein
MSVNIAGKSVGIVSDISGESENDPNALNISANSSDTIVEEQLMSAQSSGSSLPGGTLRNIILEETNKAGLPENTIKIETIRSRVKRKNLKAFNPSQQSPIKDIEPIICQFRFQLRKMGRPLTKTTIIELANDLISDTDYLKKIVTARSSVSLRRLISYLKHGTMAL